MQHFITHAALRNGGNSFFSFILQDSYYALHNKTENLYLDMSCNSVTSDAHGHLNTKGNILMATFEEACLG